MTTEVQSRMSEHASWSLHLGRWYGVQVRLHMFFILFAALTLYLTWPSAENDKALGGVSWLAVGALGVLLASVLLHEAGHAWMAARCGSRVHEIVLGPLGGLAPLEGLRSPRAELQACAAGPLANLAVCAVCLPTLAAFGESPWGLFSLLAPDELSTGATGGTVALKLVFWVNWVLLLVNLLPAFPFDGGRALRAGIMVAYPHVRRRWASFFVAGLAKVTAWSICLAAWMVQFPEGHDALSPRFALVLLAIFLFFSAKHEEERSLAESAELDDPLDLALARTQVPAGPQADAEAARTPGPFARWLTSRRELKLQRQRETEAEEERRVDEILSYVHEHGMQALSAADRDLLERVSARYRQRLQS